MSEKNEGAIKSGIRDDLIEKKFSIWTHLSYNSMFINLQLTWNMIAAYYFFFYEVVIGLNAGLIALAMALFGIWDAINDPLIGYLSDKPTRLTKRWGRRFPWILIGAFPTVISFILIWAPPQGSQIVIFLWFLLILLIHELSYTMVGGPLTALFPEKFRSDSERRKNSGSSAIAIFIAYALSSLIPPLFIIEREATSYLIAALVLMVPGVISILLGIPGSREDQEIIARVLNSRQDKSQLSFLKSLRMALKNKNFIAYSVLALSVQTAFGVMFSSLVYWLIYVLDIPIENLGIFIILYFILSIISIPFWYYLMGKIGNKYAFAVGIILQVVVFFTGILVKDYISLLIMVIFLGFGQGASSIVSRPIFSDIIDEIILKERIRKEGIYSGVYTFINRFGILLSPLIIAYVHAITAFDPDATFLTQPLTAKQGIISLISWFPALILLMSTVIFVIFYNLTNERTKSIKEELHQLNL